MPTRFCLFVALLPLASTGCLRPTTSAEPSYIVLVSAEYPGANAEAVAQSVAPLLESQINEIEGLVRIESRSANRGKYLARYYFNRTTPPDVAVVLVNNYVTLTSPVLPEEVRRMGVTVELGRLGEETQQLRLGIIDRNGHGLADATAVAEAVRDRLENAGALVDSETYPKSEEQGRLVFDENICAQYRITFQERLQASKNSEGLRKTDDLNDVFLRKDLPLRAVASVETFVAPKVRYRLNRYEVVWIAGLLPAGAPFTERETCRALAEAEIKQRFGSERFGVELVARE